MILVFGIKNMTEIALVKLCEMQDKTIEQVLPHYNGDNPFFIEEM